MFWRAGALKLISIKLYWHDVIRSFFGSRFLQEACNERQWKHGFAVHTRGGNSRKSCEESPRAMAPRVLCERLESL